MRNKKATNYPIWRETSFSNRNIASPTSIATTSLPFIVGGLTQHGPGHFKTNINNQDSFAIMVEENFIAGVICDGCTGTDPQVSREYSNNEIGAKLIARFAMDGIKQWLSRHTEIKLGVDYPNEFLASLQEHILQRLHGIICCIELNNENRSFLVSDFLMSTVIGFIITMDYYILFNSGDGYYAVNGVFHEIDEEGVYVSKLLINPDDDICRLKCISSGPSSEIRNIIIATDGCRALIEQYPDSILDYANINIGLQSGYDNGMLQAFRKHVLWSEKTKLATPANGWFDDDATILLLRRTDD